MPNKGTTQWSLLSGVMLGAGAMYFLDPARGRRRRALVRDKCFSLCHRSGGAMDATAHSLRDEGQGLIARMRSRLRREDVPDTVLVARVRSEMGHAISHPHAIEVTAENGRVTLRGPILQQEIKRLVAATSAVRGVKEVDAQLEGHEDAAKVPALQGGRPRPGRRSVFLKDTWTPALRLLVGAGGTALTAGGASRGGPVGAIATAAGVGLLARAVTNLDTRRLTGWGAGRRAVDIHKCIHILAPVEEVFAFWDNVENFPRFMSHLKSVRRDGDGRTHWVAAGPGGVSIEWTAVETRREPNKLLAWSTEPGSLLQSAGVVRFTTDANGGAIVDVQMSYNPVAGAVGHAVAAVLGVDAKTAMDEDLARLKSLLEYGKATAHHHAVYREEIEPRPQA